ncbi:MAG: DUF5678 domain-containing protein [Deltaproteobacteria bacterium]|nr:DUF5678 domain-containing protein [Deltaproteobacteria bacterium]
MEKVLVTTDEFNGRYVAMKSFDDNSIVGVGNDPEKALKDAETKGFKYPVLLYVPKEDVVHIYPVVEAIICCNNKVC